MTLQTVSTDGSPATKVDEPFPELLAVELLIYLEAAVDVVSPDGVTASIVRVGPPGR